MNEIPPIMHYLYLKKYSAKSAMNEIHKVYNTTFPSYTTAKRMFREFKNTEKNPSEIVKKKTSNQMKRIDEIQSVLDNNPNASVRLIAEQTLIPATTVWRTLVSDMGLKFQVPIMAPHVLNAELKQKRVNKCIELLRVLDGSNISLHNIITGDEAWIQWSGRVTGK